MIAKIMKKMIEYSNGNMHDINHFIKVWTYAKIIGEEERIDNEKQFILEIAAITHDIACPLCREKYGNTNSKYQEKEGGILVKKFLEEFCLDEEIVQRIVFLVCHHHTLESIDGIDYQILIEADYLVNADESHYSKDSIELFNKYYFKTDTGKQLIKALYK